MPSHHSPPRIAGLTLAILGALGSLASPAAAWPSGPSVLCETYPDAAECQGTLPNCSYCHTSTVPPVSWNAFGLALRERLPEPPGDISDGDREDLFPMVLPAALASEELADADRDGIPNVDEIELGSRPGDADDTYGYCAATLPSGAVPVAEGYDFARAMQASMILFCGRSPTYDERQAFAALGEDRATLYERVHDTVQSCLESDFWRDTALPRLADDRIRPLQSVGIRGDIPIGDYDWDYQLWSYVLTGDRDARDLLLAQYHVDYDESGELVVVEGTFDSSLGSGRAGGQPMTPRNRAGMVTTQWFFAINTMFSLIPRTTAAQALRAYMDFDLSQQEGMYPIEGEPRDIDDKGVAEGECQYCHSTLDPLAYAFYPYEGIRGPFTGVYNPVRSDLLGLGRIEIPEAFAFGESLERDDRTTPIRAWAELAVQQDAFKRNLGKMFFEYMFERQPVTYEQAAFDAAWGAMAEGETNIGTGETTDYSAFALIHRLVDLDAFGLVGVTGGAS